MKSDSYTVKVEVNLGALRIAHGSTMNEMRRCIQAARNKAGPQQQQLLKQAKQFESAAEEIQHAIDNMVIA